MCKSVSYCDLDLHDGIDFRPYGFCFSYCLRLCFGGFVGHKLLLELNQVSLFHIEIGLMLFRRLHERLMRRLGLVLHLLITLALGLLVV